MREKIKFLHKRETRAIRKRFIKNQIKIRNIFLYTSSKFSGNFNIKHLRWSKTDLFKETKSDSKKIYSMNIRSRCLEGFYKKDVLKNVTIYLFAYH